MKCQGMSSVIDKKRKKVVTTLQHDKVRANTAGLCSKFLQANNFLIMDWPALSPDMAPTEHNWMSWDAVSPTDQGNQRVWYSSDKD